ncbi:MAG: hypothetical protein AAFS02_01640 [Pseudomonadota bacterium]
MGSIVRGFAIVLAAIALDFGPARADETPDNRAALKSEISASLLGHVRSDAMEELVESGLAESDAERILAKFAEDAAECLLITAEERIIHTGGNPKEAMASLKASDFRTIFKDSNEFEQRMISCLLGVAANAGLTLE